MAIPLIPSMEETIADETGAMSEEDIAAYQAYMEEYQASIETYLKIVSDMTTVLPDTKTLSTLLDRYGNILIENFGDETVTEEALSVEGVSEDCTVYEEILTEQEVLSILREVLTTAKEDQELKGLLDMWSEAGGGEDLMLSLWQARTARWQTFRRKAPRRLIRRLQCSIQKSGQMQKERS